jgi:hypothetical protein
VQGMSNQSPPLVQRWSNPVKVRLTEEGREVAKGLLAASVKAGTVRPVPGFDHDEVLSQQRLNQTSRQSAEPKQRSKKKRKASAECNNAAEGSNRAARGSYLVLILLCMSLQSLLNLQT